MSDTSEPVAALPATAAAETDRPAIKASVYPAGIARPLWRPARLLDALLLLAFILLGVSMIAAYVTRESYFFYWDWTEFWQRSVRQFHAFQHSFREGREVLRISMGEEYNFLYTLPLLPFLWAFGTSRLAYLVGVTVVYQVPFCLAMGAVGSRMVDGRRQAAFWTAALIALLVPTTWLATFRGCPDVGAAALVTLAVWIYLGDTQLRNWQRWVALGTIWAAVPLFRRHFAYDGVAFFLAVGVQTLLVFFLDLKRGFRPALRGLIGKSLRTAAVVAVMAFWLCTLGRDALPNLTKNTLALYGRAPVSMTVEFYAESFGWLVLMLATVGYLAGTLRFAKQRGPIAFVFLTGLLCMVVWCALPRQAGFMHHLLHASLLVVPGLALAFWSAYMVPRRWLRVPLATAVAAALVLNFAAAVKPSLAIARAAAWSLPNETQPAAPENILARLPQAGMDSVGLFARNCAPYHRTDRSEVCRLLAYLRQVTTPADRIFVMNAGYVSFAMLRHTEAELYPQTKLQVVETPVNDARHWYPVENLLEADYALVLDPVSRHLPPEMQRVVEMPAEAIAKNWEIAADFAPLPEVFSLDGNQTARVYKRVRPTSLPVAVRTFEKMAAAFPVCPPGQADWICLTQRTTTGYYYWRCYQFRLGGSVPDLKLLYARTAPAEGELRGVLTLLDDRCRGAKLCLSAIDSEGRQSPLAETIVEQPIRRHEIRLSFAGCGKRHLMLTVTPLASGPSDQPGQLVLEKLTVVAAGAP